MLLCSNSVLPRKTRSSYSPHFPDAKTPSQHIANQVFLIIIPDLGHTVFCFTRLGAGAKKPKNKLLPKSATGLWHPAAVQREDTIIFIIESLL